MADEAKDGRTWAKVGAKLKGLATVKKQLETENAELKNTVTTLTTKVTDLEKQVSTPDAKDKRIAELTLQVRTTAHKAKFAALAKEAGVREDSIDALYRLSGYEPKADEPDEAALKGLLEKAKGEHAFAFAKPADGGNGNPNPAPEPKPIPGQSRGGANNGSDGTIITAEQRMDPKFMLNPANREIIQQAAKEHRFR